jgi:hypothetical protein
MSKFNYTKIVSDELLNQLMDLANRLDQAQWELGDLVIETAVQAKLSDSGYTYEDVCKAFGVVLGIRAKDFRIIADVATVFPKEEREKHPTLTWGHFFRAMGPKWEESLAWMENGIDDLGRPASVDAFLASGFGTIEKPEHPAEIAKANERKRTIRALEGISDSVKSGKIELAPEKSEKVGILVKAVVKLLSEDI